MELINNMFVVWDPGDPELITVWKDPVSRISYLASRI